MIIVLRIQTKRVLRMKRLKTRIPCVCGVLVEPRANKRHVKGFWHKNYAQVVIYLADERTPSWIAKKLGCSRMLLNYHLSKVS